MREYEENRQPSQADEGGLGVPFLIMIIMLVPLVVLIICIPITNGGQFPAVWIGLIGIVAVVSCGLFWAIFGAIENKRYQRYVEKHNAWQRTWVGSDEWKEIWGNRTRQ